MKTNILILLTTLLSFSIHAQNYYEQFHNYFQNGTEKEQLDVLTEWENKAPNDAELYTCLFNFYFQKSKDEIVVLNSGQPPKDEEVLILRDSTNNVAGFIGSKINYDESTLKQAFESIDKGIKLFPNRLDMRFGKIYALGQIKDWNNFTKEIIKTIHYSAQNKNKWTWTYNQERDNGEDFFLTCLQDYQNQLYSTMDDALLSNMQDIAQAVLKHYPTHVESLSNMSIGYLVSKQYDKALVPLLKAEEINPNDYIVLSNIAYAYKEMGETEKAIRYYSMVLQLGDEQLKEQAEQALKILKNN